MKPLTPNNSKLQRYSLKGLSICLSLLPMSVGISVYGQTNTNASKADDEVSITITRNPLPLKTMAQSLEIISPATLSLKSPTFLVDALNEATSLHIIKNGGPGQSANLSLRGGSGDHTLLLLEGIPLNDPSLVGGGTNTGAIATSALGSIEILRGPAGAIWGAGSMGGVINLRLKKSPIGYHGHFGLSSSLKEPKDSATATFEASLAKERTDIALYSLGVLDKSVSAFDKGTEKEAVSLSDITLLARHAPSSRLKLLGYIQNSRSKTAYDGFAPPTYSFGDTGDYATLKSTTAQLNLTYTLDHSTVNVSTGITRSDRNTYDDYETQGFASQGTLYTTALMWRFKPLSNIQVLLASGVQNENITIATPSYSIPANFTSAEDILKAKRALIYGFGLVNIAVNPNMNIEAGARLEDQDGHAIQTFHLGAKADISTNLQVRLNYADGYKTPSLYQRFSEYSNPDLRPEKSHQSEIGFDYDLLTQRLPVTISATYYVRKSVDLIGFGICSGRTDTLCAQRPYGYYLNTQKVRFEGLELRASGRILETLTLKTYLTMMKNLNVSQRNTPLKLARAPETLGGVTVIYHAPLDISAYANLRYVAKAFDDAQNQNILSSYSVFDIAVTGPVSKHWQWRLKGENLGDSKTQTALGFGYTPRKLWLGLDLRW